MKKTMCVVFVFLSAIFLTSCVTQTAYYEPAYRSTYVYSTPAVYTTYPDVYYGNYYGGYGYGNGLGYGLGYGLLGFGLGYALGGYGGYGRYYHHGWHGGRWR